MYIISTYTPTWYVRNFVKTSTTTTLRCTTRHRSSHAKSTKSWHQGIQSIWRFFFDFLQMSGETWTLCLCPLQMDRGKLWVDGSGSQVVGWWQCSKTHLGITSYCWNAYTFCNKFPDEETSKHTCGAGLQLSIVSQVQIFPKTRLFFFCVANFQTVCIFRCQSLLSVKAVLPPEMMHSYYIWICSECIPSSRCFKRRGSQMFFTRSFCSPLFYI